MPKVVVDGNKITVKPTLKETKDKYIKLIQEAQILGETDEVAKLQTEWRGKKNQYS